MPFYHFKGISILYFLKSHVQRFNLMHKESEILWGMKTFFLPSSAWFLFYFKSPECKIFCALRLDSTMTKKYAHSCTDAVVSEECQKKSWGVNFFMLIRLGLHFFVTFNIRVMFFAFFCEREIFSKRIFSKKTCSSSQRGLKIKFKKYLLIINSTATKTSNKSTIMSIHNVGQ